VNYFTLSPAVGPLYLNFEVYPESAHAANPARWLQLAGHRLRVAGRFNDPSANACTADDVRPPADPVVTCRSRFVALRIEDLGKR
jgi:hypothetical protein